MLNIKTQKICWVKLYCKQSFKKLIAILMSTTEKDMVTLSTILAWEIPWTEEPAGLQSMGLQKGQIGLSY